MRTPKEEREIIAGGYVYSENGERAARMEVYTSDYSYMAKFDGFCEENPEEWNLEKVEEVDGDVVAKRYSFPTSCLSFRRGKNKISDAERQAMIERGRASVARLRGESSAD